MIDTLAQEILDLVKKIPDSFEHKGLLIEKTGLMLAETLAFSLELQALSQKVEKTLQGLNGNTTKD